jgi:hypothetical protein
MSGRAASYNTAVSPISGGVAVITCTYDPTGRAWCAMQDSALVAWLIDTGDASALPWPVILTTNAARCAEYDTGAIAELVGARGRTGRDRVRPRYDARHAAPAV